MPGSANLQDATPQFDLRVQARDQAGGTGVHKVFVTFDRSLVGGAGKTTLTLDAWNSTRDGQPISLDRRLPLDTLSTQAGTYRIDDVTILDLAGNRTSYGRAQLDALGMNTTLKVENTSTPILKVAPSLAKGALVLDLTSAAWSTSAPNTFKLVLNLSGEQIRFEGASLVSNPGKALDVSVSSDYTNVTISGTGITAAEALAGIRLALRPVEDAWPSSWSLSEFMLNGQQHYLGDPMTRGGVLLGGAGHDTRSVGVYHDRDEVVVTRTPGGFEVQSADGEKTVVAGVERLAFVGRAMNMINDEDYVALDTDGVAGQAYRLYQAAVDRTPDEAGLGYWIHQMDRGMSLTDVAQAFMAGSEFRSLYGSNLSDTGFITALYDNVLHRAPDEAGLAWWRDALVQGLTRQEALVYFSESAENVAQVAPAIVNGIDYTLW
jgi:hypothetical protein